MAKLIIHLIRITIRRCNFKIKHLIKSDARKENLIDKMMSRIANKLPLIRKIKDNEDIGTYIQHTEHKLHVLNE